MTPPPSCRICCGRLEPFDTGVVLRVVEVTYFCCRGCGAVVLPEPTWLGSAYSDAISALDVGLMNRCLRAARLTRSVVRAEGLSGGRFLDWAGGYGVLTRLLRDDGLDFRHWDPHTANLFAQGCEGDPEAAYDLVTAYEVLEHLTDPVEALAGVAAGTDRLLVSTFLVAEPPPRVQGWWYYAAESGQHVTFYSRRSLQVLAERWGFSVVTDGVSQHLFHRGPLRLGTRWRMSPLAARVRARRGSNSLLPGDASAAAERLRQG